MKTKISLFLILLFSQLAFAQKKGEVTGQLTIPSCKCSELELYPFMYYQDPSNPETSNLLLRFDFHRKGVVKCKPEFLGNISLFRNTTISVSFPAKDLTSLTNTDGQRIFIIPRSQLPASFGTIANGATFKAVYSLSYGTKSVCPASSSKLIKFQKSEPII